MEWEKHRASTARTGGRRLDSGALATHVAKAYDAVSAGRGEARIAYDAKSWSPSPSGAPAADRTEIEARLLEALVSARPSEVERGVTLAGPHRDDVTLTLGELPAKGYASHGESWSYALALRLAAFELLRAEGIEPVRVLEKCSPSGSDGANG